MRGSRSVARWNIGQSNAHHVIRRSDCPSRSAGKAIRSERSAFNRALAKALALRDAGKMPEAREWAAELVRLLRAHDLLT
jgi:hypothetical protein